MSSLVCCSGMDPVCVSVSVRGPHCLCLGDRLKRNHTHTHTHAHAKCTCSGTGPDLSWELGCTDSAKVRNSLPPLVLMMTPKLERHVGNFSCLSGKQPTHFTHSLNLLHSTQIISGVMLCQRKSSESESDCEIMQYTLRLITMCS